jgi:hypothetical protein
MLNLLLVQRFFNSIIGKLQANFFIKWFNR